MSYPEDPPNEESSDAPIAVGDINILKSSHSAPLRKRIEIRILAYEREIGNLKELLRLLDENPAIEKFQNLSSKVHI